MIIATLFTTVFFCLGLYLTSRDGYLLDFLQKPFKWAEKVLELKKFALKLNIKDRLLIILAHVLNFLSSPFIMCITCMGSIWGAFWFVVINGFALPMLPYLIFNCFAAAFIQTFMWKLYERIL